MNIKEETSKMKLAAPRLAASTNEQRNTALQMIAENLKCHEKEIFAANHEDMEAAASAGAASAAEAFEV